MGEIITWDAINRYVTDRRDRQEIQKETVRSFRETLWLFADEVGHERPLSSISRRHLDAWTKAMGLRHLAPATIRLRIGTLKGFFKWAVLEGHVRSDPTLGIRLPKLPRYLPRGLKDRQVAELLDQCADARERLIVLLMRREGLRAIEVANLQMADVDPDERTMIVRGKGGHERALPVVDEVWAALWSYLDERGTFAGRLLQSYQRSYAAVDDGLSAKYVATLVGKVFRRAGIDSSGHALRHSFATEMLRNGANLA